MDINYKITDRGKRMAIVEEIIAEKGNSLSPRELEMLSDYVLFAMDKEEKKSKEILTPNRKVTLDKRETSYEELGEKLICGEEEIQNFVTNDKNIIFNNNIKITQKDIDEIPELKKLRDEIDKVKTAYDKAEPGSKKKAFLKKQIIEMSKDQYIIKASYRKPLFFNKVKKINTETFIDFSENLFMNKNGEIESDGIVSLIRPKDISSILKNYDKLKVETFDSYNADIKWIIDELHDLINKLEPFYKDLTLLKIQGMQNVEIQKYLEEKYGTKHSLEYLSSLWKHKIPKKISEIKKTEWLLWYYKEHRPTDWKKCTKCGEEKPRHNKFFSKNKTSKDGLYSICKCCRNNK